MKSTIEKIMSGEGEYQMEISTDIRHKDKLIYVISIDGKKIYCDMSDYKNVDEPADNFPWHEAHRYSCEDITND